MPSQLKPLVVRVPAGRILALKSLARRLAAERDERCTTSDLVREALEMAFPELSAGDDPRAGTALVRAPAALPAHPLGSPAAR